MKARLRGIGQRRSIVTKVNAQIRDELDYPVRRAALPGLDPEDVSESCRHFWIVCHLGGQCGLAEPSRASDCDHLRAAVPRGSENESTQLVELIGSLNQSRLQWW